MDADKKSEKKTEIQMYLVSHGFSYGNLPYSNNDNEGFEALLMVGPREWAEDEYLHMTIKWYKGSSYWGIRSNGVKGAALRLGKDFDEKIQKAKKDALAHDIIEKTHWENDIRIKKGRQELEELVPLQLQQDIKFYAYASNDANRDEYVMRIEHKNLEEMLTLLTNIFAAYHILG